MDLLHESRISEKEPIRRTRGPPLRSLEQLLQQIWEPINRIYKLEVCAEWKA